MAGARSIEPTKPISKPGGRPCGPSRARLANHRKLQQIVASKLLQDWSPEQISGWLKREYPKNEGLRVSHETIYRALFIQARGALKQELMRLCGRSGKSRSNKSLHFASGTSARDVTVKSPKVRPTRFVSFPI